MRFAKTTNIFVISLSCTLIGCAHTSGDRKPSSHFPSIEGTNVAQVPDKKQITATAQYHFAMAQAYSAEGNPDRAIEEYKLALIYDSNEAIVYARLATEYIKKGMLSAAMETCNEAIHKDPKYTDARLILAGLFSSTQQNDEAIAHYDAVLKYDPENEEAAVYKAQALIEQEKPTVAAQTLKNFLKKNPDSAVAWYYLGRTQNKSEKFADAEKSYKKAIEIKPHFVQAYLSMGYMFEETKKNDRAIQTYLEIYEDTQDSTAASRLATIYLKKEKYKEAIPYLESIEATDPSDMNAKVKLGLVYMEVKNYDRAIVIFNELVKKNPDSDRIRFYLGSLYEELGRPADAVAELKQVPSSSKLYSDAVLHSANLMKNAGKSDEAKKILKQAIDQSPTITQLSVFLASIYEDEKGMDQAIQVLEKAYVHAPEDEKVLYYLGNLYDRQGDVTKGLAKMEQVLFLNPKNVDALNYIGYTWSIQGVKLSEAEKYLRLAMQLKPDNAYVTDSWGWHLYLTGKIKQAIVQLEKAVQLKNDETTILEHLADAYARANLQEKALSTYEKAAKYAEDDQAKLALAQKMESLRTVLVQGGRMPASRTNARSPASVSGVSNQE